MRFRWTLLVLALVLLVTAPASASVLTATDNSGIPTYTLAMGSGVTVVTLDKDPNSSKFRIREAGDTMSLTGSAAGQCTAVSDSYVCTPPASAVSITNSGGSSAPPQRDQVIVAGPAHGDPPATWSPVGANVQSSALIEVWLGDKLSSVGGSDIAVGTPAEPADIVHAAGSDVFCITGCLLRAGADRYEGSDKADNILGGEGDDVLLGGKGDDNLSGDGGNDIVQGGLGKDNVLGKDGVDTLSFDDAARTHGLSGTFTAGTAGTLGDPTDDAKTGGGGTPGDTYDNTFERILGTPLNDTLTGGAAAEVMDGGAGDDVLDGAGGNDELTGGLGLDTLTGGAGADVIHAQDGLKDTVDCGTEADSAELDDIDAVSGCETTAVKQTPKPVGTFAPTNNPFPPAGGPPPGTTPATLVKAVLAARVSARFAAGRKGTKVTRLQITGAESGTTIVVSCKARRKGACPFTSRTVKTKKKGTVVLTTLFKRRRLPVGTVVRLTVTEAGGTTLKTAYTVRRSRQPSRKSG